MLQCIKSSFKSKVVANGARSSRKSHTRILKCGDKKQRGIKNLDAFPPE